VVDGKAIGGEPEANGEPEASASGISNGEPEA